MNKAGLANGTERSGKGVVAPCINAPAVFGAHPGTPFSLLVAVSGARPVRFEAHALPSGVTLNAETGLIKGSIALAGTHVIQVTATNAGGASEKRIRLEIGERIGLTPPMGWNSWNCWGGAVSEEKVLSSARALIDLGLTDYGWSYINVDDGWQSQRGGPHRAIQPNGKFPDMKRLADRIHAMGLKFGIYSSPWKGTYEGHVGSSCDREDGVYEWIAAGDRNEHYRIGRSDAEWQVKRRQNYGFGKYSFVENDVRQWAEWGVDYLKYDWKPIDVPHVREVHRLLRQSGRNIFLSLSNKAPFWQAREWEQHANAWRTTADIEDTWESVKAIGFSQDRWSSHSGPGHWNDPDMLVLGHVGWGAQARLTRLTFEEQRSHFSLWCLLAAPLLLGCDLARLDPQTIGLLTNSEVLAVNQDPLGQQGVRVAGDQHHQVIVKIMEDGSLAVGMFNLSGTEEKLTLQWDDLLISGSSRRVRDLWSRAEEGIHSEMFSADVPAHGVKLVKLSEVADFGK